MNRPSLLLCDEPTGNLDAKNSQAIGDLLRGVAGQSGAMLVVVTHSPALAEMFDRRRADGGRRAGLNRRGTGSSPCLSHQNHGLVARATRTLSKLRLILRNLLYFRAANLAVAARHGRRDGGADRRADGRRQRPREPARAGGAAARAGRSRAGRHAVLRAVARRPHPASQLRRQIRARARRSSSAAARRTPTATARTRGVQIAAVGAAGIGEAWVPVAPRQAVVNGEVAGALEHREARRRRCCTTSPTALDTPARRDARPPGRERGRRPATACEVARVATEPGFASLFNLEGSQRVPRNVWLNLADLQRRRRPARADQRDPRRPASGDASVDELNRALRQSVTLADYGLSHRPRRAEPGSRPQLAGDVHRAAGARRRPGGGGGADGAAARGVGLPDQRRHVSRRRRPEPASRSTTPSPRG